MTTIIREIVFSRLLRRPELLICPDLQNLGLEVPRGAKLRDSVRAWLVPGASDI